MFGKVGLTFEVGLNTAKDDVPQLDSAHLYERLQKGEVPTNKPQAEQLDRELWRLSFQIVDSSMISDAARLSPPWKQKPTDNLSMTRETMKDNDLHLYRTQVSLVRSIGPVVSH